MCAKHPRGVAGYVSTDRDALCGADAGEKASRMPLALWLGKPGRQWSSTDSQTHKAQEKTSYHQRVHTTRHVEFIPDPDVLKHFRWRMRSRLQVSVNY